MAATDDAPSVPERPLTVRERALPVRMRRIAVIALSERLREVLVTLAQSGAVDLAGPLGNGEGPALDALRRLEGARRGEALPAPALTREAPDLEKLERSGAVELLAGEVELARRSASALQRDDFVLLVGWAPAPAVPHLSGELQSLGASLVALRRPLGQQPPSLLAPASAAEPFRPLISTYGAVPYDDLDPTPFVAVTYCLMFGMMFGDVGDGLLIVLAALALARSRHPRLAGLRRVWPLIAAAGAAATLFGELYGEFFGPTGVLPALWLEPLSQPTRLLYFAIGAGAGLLVITDVIAIVNRWREGGAVLALTSWTGIPGLALLAGAGLVVLGSETHSRLPQALGLTLAVVSLIPLAIGLRAESGGGATAIGEVAIGLFDALLRLLSNVFSFARLAAFGLMHAAIGQVVLHAAGSLTGSPVGDLAGAVLFFVGWTVAFALEGLVVSVQALRLEYYELFSRLFAREGRPFRPWSLRLLPSEEVR